MSCARCASPLEVGDIRCAVCSLPAPAGSDAPARTTASILRCDECGAAVTYSAEHVGTRCPFCGAVAHLEQPADPIEAAEGFLPFRVSPAEAAAALRSWMDTLGFFRPSDLAAKATVDHIRPLFFAGWLFEADALVSWAADSDAGSGSSEWAPHSGQVPMRFDNVLVSASRGLSAQEVARLASGFQLTNIAPEPVGATEAMVERFDVQRSTARAIIANAVHGTAYARTESGQVPGRRVRNCHISVMVQALQSRRYGFPAYVLAYRYGDKAYRAVVHGQDAAIAFGDAPLSIRKILLVAFGVAALVLIIVAVLSNR